MLLSVLQSKVCLLVNYQFFTNNSLESRPELAQWVEHKEIPLIAAGLCKACSPIPEEIYDQSRRHTNAVEQSHYKAYFLGTRDSLLQAVLKYVSSNFFTSINRYFTNKILLPRSQTLDQRDMDQYHHRENHDIRHSYYADDIMTRFKKSRQRESK